MGRVQKLARGAFGLLSVGGQYAATRVATAWRAPRIHGIHHTGLTVSNFEDAVSWWSQLFGFRLVAEQTISGARAEQLAGLYGAPGLTVRLGFLWAPGGNVLEIFTFDPPIDPQRTDWRRPGYTHVALCVRNLPALCRRLKAEGIRFETGVEFAAGAHWAFFRDPDGNLVELIDLHGLRLPLRYLGGAIGNVHKRGKWAAYYR